MLRGLNKLFYNMNIDSICVEEHEVNMLLKLRAHDWSRSLANFHEPSLREKAVQVAGLDRKDLEKGGFVTEH